MKELLETLENVRNQVLSKHEEHASTLGERDALNHEIIALKMELAELRGERNSLAKNCEDLKDRLSDAVEDSSYFRTQVGTVTQAATEMADKMVRLVRDVERKPKPMLSLDNLEEKPRKELETKPTPQIKLNTQEWAEIGSMPDGEAFELRPDAKASRREAKHWYRQKVGIVPNNYDLRPGIQLRKVGNKLEFLRYIYPEPRPFRPEEPQLPVAATIPHSSGFATRTEGSTAGDVNAHGQFADDGGPAPSFLMRPIDRNGGTNDRVG